MGSKFVMSRRIRTTALESTGKGAVDTYFDRVIKYIPTDIVSAWVAVTGIVKGAGAGVPTNAVLWGCFVFGALLTPFWTLKQTQMEGVPPAWLQASMGTVAFVVWVFAMGDPFTSLSFYHQLYGSLALIAFTLISGLIVP
jgi:hypothetical protein